MDRFEAITLSIYRKIIMNNLDLDIQKSKLIPDIIHDILAPAFELTAWGKIKLAGYSPRILELAWRAVGEQAATLPVTYYLKACESIAAKNKEAYNVKLVDELATQWKISRFSDYSFRDKEKRQVQETEKPKPHNSYSSDRQNKNTGNAYSSYKVKRREWDGTIGTLAVDGKGRVLDENGSIIDPDPNPRQFSDAQIEYEYWMFEELKDPNSPTVNSKGLKQNDFGAYQVLGASPDFNLFGFSYVELYKAGKTTKKPKDVHIKQYEEEEARAKKNPNYHNEAPKEANTMTDIVRLAMTIKPK